MSTGIIVRLVLYPALIYGGLILSVYFRQHRILYHPRTLTGEQVDRELGWYGLQRWPDPDAESYRGLIDVSPPESPRATVVVLHGNAGWAADRHIYIDALSRRGMRVLLLEYSGYGGREGDLGERALVADALESVRLAHAMYGSPFFLWGESLGSGVAAAVTAHVPEIVDGVVMHTPWSRLTDVARHYYPYLPVRLLSRDRYDNIANLSEFNGPVAVLLCEYDSVVPARYGDRLYEALNPPKRRWMFSGVDHNEWPVSPDMDWWDEVVGFLLPNK